MMNLEIILPHPRPPYYCNINDRLNFLRRKKKKRRKKRRRRRRKKKKETLRIMKEMTMMMKMRK